MLRAAIFARNAGYPGFRVQRFKFQGSKVKVQKLGFRAIADCRFGQVE
jgi:hypothetical protein